MQQKENAWQQLRTFFINSAGRLQFQSRNNASKEAEWRIIHLHSAAKISKTLAEQYYAPQPLPVELHRNFDMRIETSRNQLLQILKEQIVI